MRCFRSLFVSLFESFQSIPGDSQQNICRNSGECQVSLKALYCEAEKRWRSFTWSAGFSHPNQPPNNCQTYSSSEIKSNPWILHCSWNERDKKKRPNEEWKGVRGNSPKEEDDDDDDEEMRNPRKLKNGGKEIEKREERRENKGRTEQRKG